MFLGFSPDEMTTEVNCSFLEIQDKNTSNISSCIQRHVKSRPSTFFIKQLSFLESLLL